MYMFFAKWKSRMLNDVTISCGCVACSFYSGTFKMADALQASCTAPVFKRPRLDFSPCEGDTLISYESMSSEERFSVDSGLQEDAYDVNLSNDCPSTQAPTSGSQDFGSTVLNDTGLPSSNDPQVYQQCASNDLGAENHSNMLAHESFMESRVTSDSQEGLDENEVEEQDSISELSGLSDITNVSEDDHITTASEMWVQRQRNNGIDPRLILEEILPQGSFIPNNINESLLWRYIMNMLHEPRRTKLSNVNTLDDAVNLLRTCKRIIVLTGAGVSVSCGIPDFRSRNGIYARLSKDYPDLPDPQAMFDINYFSKDPRPFFKFAKEIYPGLFQPSPSHHFIKLLEKQGRLLRNYTQNIDTLEHAAGIQNVITCHGSFATASCTVCKHKVDSSVIKEDIFNQTIPYCPICPADSEVRGIMKPDIVFFGEGLSDEFHDSMNRDKGICDLLIVIGSSLKVRPVATIPSSIPMNVPQILINREPLKHLTFDIELLGDCDVIIGELCRRLASDWEVNNIPFPTLREIDASAVPPNLPPPNGLTPTDSASFSEINNNFELSQNRTCAGPSLSQSEESNSCDYNGLSAIKLDDSEDGSNQGLVSRDPGTTKQEPIASKGEISSNTWHCNSEDVLSKKLPDKSYVFVPPSRYIFPGAEVYREDEDDSSSSSSADYSSDSESPPRPLEEDAADDNSHSTAQQSLSSPLSSGCDHSQSTSETAAHLEHSRENEGQNT